MFGETRPCQGRPYVDNLGAKPRGIRLDIL